MIENNLSFTARMFLRDYAVIEQLHGNTSHRVNYNFAALATTGWFTVLSFLSLLCVSFLLRDFIPHSINPLTAEKRVLLLECLAIPFIVDFFVERSIRSLRDGRPACVDRFKAPAERFKWWASLASTLLMTVLISMVLIKARPIE